MDTIDKQSMSYIKAQDALVQRINDDMIDPPDDSKGTPVLERPRRQRDSETVAFMKRNTLATLERLHNIAMDTLYTRDDEGQRHRVSVPVGVQLQAAVNFLDRAMGKPQVNIDLSVGERPVVFDSELQAPPLIQGSDVSDTIATNVTLELGSDEDED